MTLADLSAFFLIIVGPDLGLAPVRVEDALAEADGRRCALDQLVRADVAQSLLQGELARRDELDNVVVRVRAHVCELLGAHGVDVEVVVARVFSHDHALLFHQR